MSSEDHAMTLTYRFSTIAFATLSALTLSACQGGDDPAIDDFISDDPNAGGGYGEEGADEGDPGGTGDGDGDDNGGEEPDISEADIIQREGDRLYALSAYSGLTVVDIQDPDNLQALGSWDTDADPFEMYVEAGRAFVMFNDYGFWEYDEGFDEWTYASSSRLVALDASNPADIQVRGEFTLPGRIQDSRRVGDVLYLVTLEDGWCWGCEGGQETVVTSLDISDEANPKIVDQLTFTAPNANWDWQRSVESTTQRMYLASRTWTWEGAGSVIDVVDISAGDGTLVAGADVPVMGSVFSRWQMSEHEDVLRVISQRGWSEDPAIETFQITSAQEISKIGEGSLSIPMPESLRSVRYDGDRAYAITAEQIDPLFTIDLSDPAEPKQIGELEIPGWVYHMEPRGDRILALGFDPAHADGSLNVSLFDVSDFAAPTLRRRVHFGGDWANFAEDQNRIHKAFTILEDEQMLLVPHSGWDYGDDFECSGKYRSGVQIIDWKDDDLTLRGLLPSRGRVRRAFTHAQRILTVSDNQLTSFEYSDRDAPVARDSLALAVHVDNLVRAGGVWVRVARDWWTGAELLEVVDGDNPGGAEPLGTIELGEAGDCAWSWISKIFARGDHVFVVREVYSYSWEDEYGTELTEVIAVDVGDPTAPVVVDTYELSGRRSWGVGQLAGVISQSSWVAHDGDHLAFLLEDEQTQKPQVQVLDLSDPANITLAATLARPAGQTQGELSVLSDSIVSWHTEPVEGQPGKVRFYFDRLEVDGGDPHWAPKINVPGVIVAYDHQDHQDHQDQQASRAFTVDFKIETVALGPEACYEHPKFWRFEYNDDYETGTCKLIERTLKRLSITGSTATLVASIDIEGDASIQQLYATNSRIFARASESSSWGDAPDGDYQEPDTRMVIVDIAGADTTVHQLEGESLGAWWWLARVEGERAVVNTSGGKVGLIDASDPSQPEVRQSSLPGWGGCYNPILDGDTVYCPMGAYGLETVEW
ncbi:MAG: beta-propeller domain-containing protein [Enhygromyxa sp.]